MPIKAPMKNTDPEMPGDGSQFVEVDFAEGDEEYQEHEHRQNRIEDGIEEIGCFL